MQLRFLVVLLLFPVFLIAQTPAENIKRAKEMMDKNNFKGAKKFLSSCIEKEINNPEYFYLRAECNYQLGDGQGSLGDLNWAIKLAPDSVKYWHNRATVYYALMEFAKSEKDYLKALALTRGRVDSATIMAEYAPILVFLGDTARALKMYVEALALDSLNFAVLVNYGNLLNDIDRSPEAIMLLTKALAQDTNHVMVNSNIGFTYSEMGEYQKAIPYFDRCIRLDPNSAFPYSNRAYCKLKTGDTKGALRDVQKSIKLFPENSYAHRNLGLIYLEMGEKEKACAAFEEALRYGFRKLYGPEVNEMKKKNCG
ncbi:MAG TPA: tetratricopeptide repeat protein [Bacteroidia bacterium]|nr:tetratricopeptide repeat protein [Bacteroidia bacterium]